MHHRDLVPDQQADQKKAASHLCPAAVSDITQGAAAASAAADSSAAADTGDAGVPTGAQFLYRGTLQ